MVGGRIQDGKIPVTGHRVRLLHRHRDQGVPALVEHHPEVRTGLGHAAAGESARVRQYVLFIYLLVGFRVVFFFFAWPQNALVHTPESIRTRYFVDLLMEHRHPVMLVGGAGCGKTVLMGEKLSSLSDNYAVANIPFNYYTTSGIVSRSVSHSGRSCCFPCRLIRLILRLIRGVCFFFPYERHRNATKDTGKTAGEKSR